jgi:anti-sigma-K factor RskA
MNEHDDDVRGLLPAWALDAVDDVERRRVERAIRDDPELAAEAAALLDTAAGLAAGSAITPPSEMRARVLAAVADAPQVEATDESRTDRRAMPDRTRAPRRRPWARWAVAAAILVAAAVPGAIAVQQYQRAERAESQVAELAEAVVRPGAELVRADVAGGGEAVVVLAGHEAVFLASDLPELEGGRDYQLWVIEEDGITSAGVLETDGGRAGAEVTGLSDGSVLGVTVEPGGGSQQPTSDPIVTLAAG